MSKFETIEAFQDAIKSYLAINLRIDINTMHVIHRLQARCRQVRKTSPLLTTWTWPCPTRRQTVCLTQHEHGVTTLHVHGQIVKMYSGQRTPADLWTEMTSLLLEHNVICATEHTLESLDLPVLDNECM